MAQLKYHLSVFLLCHLLPPLGCCCDPLLLTPLLDQNDTAAALERSEVKDPESIIPKSYAGFITVDRQLGNHLFFWFFPAVSRSDAPLLVWLNGGPGVSSMLGLAWENGPIRVRPTDNGSVTYERWNQSWAETFSMLYIDNPVGVGYSYSDSGENGVKATQDGYAEDLYSFIEQFYVMFPEYLERELYIGGQSYAGKYVPAFAYRIHNEFLAGTSNIPLAGIYLGGPFFDPHTQTFLAGEYFYAMGAISKKQLIKAKEVVNQIFDCFDSDGESTCMDFSQVMLKMFSFYGIYAEFTDNIVGKEIPGHDDTAKLLNSSVIRNLIHVGHELKYTIDKFEWRYSTFVPDLLKSSKAKLAELMDNYKVLLFVGDFDGFISPEMVEGAVMTTPWSRQAEYNDSERKVWRDLDSQVIGFYTHVGQFCNVVIHGSGHHIPHDQPVVSRNMMTQFIKYGCITNWDE